MQLSDAVGHGDILRSHNASRVGLDCGPRNALPPPKRLALLP